MMCFGWKYLSEACPSTNGTQTQAAFSLWVLGNLLLRSIKPFFRWFPPTMVPFGRVNSGVMRAGCQRRTGCQQPPLNGSLCNERQRGNALSYITFNGTSFLLRSNYRPCFCSLGFSGFNTALCAAITQGLTDEWRYSPHSKRHVQNVLDTV